MMTIRLITVKPSLFVWLSEFLDINGPNILNKIAEDQTEDKAIPWEALF